MGVKGSTVCTVKESVSRFRSFYFSNNWDVKHWTNKDAPVKTPEHRLSTSWSTFFPLLPAVFVQFLIVCNSTLARSVCTKKLTRTIHLTATYLSMDLELLHISLALRRGGGRARARSGVYVEANPNSPFYLPRHIGRDEGWKKYMDRLHRSQSSLSQWEMCLSWWWREKTKQIY